MPYDSQKGKEENYQTYRRELGIPFVGKEMALAECSDIANIRSNVVQYVQSKIKENSMNGWEVCFDAYAEAKKLVVRGEDKSYHKPLVELYEKDELMTEYIGDFCLLRSQLKWADVDAEFSRRLRDEVNESLSKIEKIYSQKKNNSRKDTSSKIVLFNNNYSKRGEPNPYDKGDNRAITPPQIDCFMGLYNKNPFMHEFGWSDQKVKQNVPIIYLMSKMIDYINGTTTCEGRMLTYNEMTDIANGKYRDNPAAAHSLIQKTIEEEKIQKTG